MAKILMDSNLRNREGVSDLIDDLEKRMVIHLTHTESEYTTKWGVKKVDIRFQVKYLNLGCGSTYRTYYVFGLHPDNAIALLGDLVDYLD